MRKSRIKIWAVLAFLCVNILASAVHLSLHHDGDVSSAASAITTPEDACVLCAVHHTPVSFDAPQTYLSPAFLLNSTTYQIILSHVVSFSLLGVAPKNSPPSFLA